MAHAFDTLKFAQRLERAGVEREQAVAHAEIARDMILAAAASKENFGALRKDLQDDLRREIIGVRKDVGDLEAKIGDSLRELELRMTIKLGAIVVAAVAAVAAI
jgi:hypothetical protein